MRLIFDVNWWDAIIAVGLAFGWLLERLGVIDPILIGRNDENDGD